MVNVCWLLGDAMAGTSVGTAVMSKIASQILGVATDSLAAVTIPPYAMTTSGSAVMEIWTALVERTSKAVVNYFSSYPPFRNLTDILH